MSKERRERGADKDYFKNDVSKDAIVQNAIKMKPRASEEMCDNPSVDGEPSG